MNDSSFLLSTLDLLEAAGIQVWVFGGWAEELWGLIAPRHHQDVDFLFPACDFTSVDRLLVVSPEMREIKAKRFLHKRAFLLENILVELILAQSSGQPDGRYETNFFSSGYRFSWPQDTFGLTVFCFERTVRVASPSALQAYRERHAEIEASYAALGGTK